MIVSILPRAQANGIDPVRIGGDTAGLGTRYYEDPEADSLEESVEVTWSPPFRTEHRA